MRLEDIKGKRQLQVVGKLMTIADSLHGDPKFESFMEAIRDGKREEAVLKLGPLLVRDEIADDLIEVVAFAMGVPADQVEDPIGEIMELVTSDVEMPAFLSGQQ